MARGYLTPVDHRQPTEADQLRRIAPTHMEGINLRGTYYFQVALYAKRILSSTATDNAIASTSQRA